MSEYLQKIAQYNVRKRWPSWEHTALLVIDMQKYFSGMAYSIIDNVVKLIATCHKRQVPIIYTRHGHKSPKKDGGMLGQWWGDLIIYESEDWFFMDEICPSQREMVIDKNRYSAFYHTELHQKLQKMGVEELLICGVMTNCCCETTARDAFVHDYRVFFLADATATVSEDLHLATLKTLAFGFAYIVDTEQLCV